MTLFIKRIIFFSIPVVFVFVSIELFIYYSPNTFNAKAKFLKNNLNIEALFLGSSHTQNSINPEYLEISSSNLAYGGQDVQLDSALFFKYIKNLSKLKYLILELDYHSLEEMNTPSYYGLPWYYRYHKIQLFNIPMSNKVSLYRSAPDIFMDDIIRKISPWGYKYQINKFGFITNDFPGIFIDMSYDSLKIVSSAVGRLKNRHAISSYYNFILNTRKMNSMIEYCLEKGIKVILLSNPVYLSYRNNYVKDKDNRRHLYLDSLSKLQNVFRFNFENDNRFFVNDFKNDDHLNPSGAKKYTLLVNECLKKLR